MSSSVQLGSVSLSGSSPRLTGSASELDTETLVNALTEARRLPAVRFENQITENEAKIAAYGELRTMLGDMQSALEGLRNPPGFFSADENLFESKAAFFSSNTTTQPGELLGIGVTNSASAGSFEIIVDQIATARKFSGDSVSSSAAPLADELNGGTAFSGSFSLGLEGSGTSATINVDGTMDINDVRGAINAVSDETGVTASVLKVSDSDFRLVLTANETGKEVQMANVAGDDALNILGLSTDGGTTFKNSIQAADKAIIQVDGIAITRDSNTIDDVLDGVTFEVFKAEPGTTLTVDIEQSLGAAKEQIVAFVEAYNTYRSFVASQNVVSETGEIGEGSPLFGDSTLRSISQSISNFTTGQVSGLDANALSSLAGIGVTMNQENLLQIDENKLDELLLNDPDTVRDVFEFRFESSSPDLVLFARGNTLNDSDFTIEITDADNDGIAESATIDGVAAEIDGNAIKGVDGTAYEGLEFIWTGSGSTSINVTATQGVAEKLYNYIDGVIDDVDGTLTSASDALEDANTEFTDEIAFIEERAETFRQSLIERFAAMEAALALADSMLQQVRAQTDAMTSDN